MSKGEKRSAVSRKRAAGNTGPKPTNVATFTKRKKVNEGKVCPRGKAAAKRKFKVWPSAYASGWGVRCTKAGGPSKFGGSKKK